MNILTVQTRDRNAPLLIGIPVFLWTMIPIYRHVPVRDLAKEDAFRANCSR